MNITATNKKLHDLLRGIGNGTLIPRPEFQRRLVWTNRDKVKFIDTVLKGYPFPEIYVAAGEIDLDTAEGTELLVDGQQRMSTLYQYFVGSSELKLGALPPYQKLTPEEKQKSLQYDVVVRYIGPMKLSEIKAIFERINATAYSLNAMEIHNARYAGEFKQFAEETSQLEFFERHRTFSANEIRRMDDVKFALQFIITVMSSYFNRDEELEEYLKNYNDSFPQKSELKNHIALVIDFFEDCNFESQSPIWKKSNLFTALVEFYKALVRDSLKLDPHSVSSSVNRLFSEIEARGTEQAETVVPPSELESYYKASLQATNDRGSRIRRGEIFAKVIRMSLNPSST